MKVTIHKYDNLIGAVELTNTGGFRFDGPQADWLQRGMEEVRLHKNLDGRRALEYFLREYFGQASFIISVEE